jgi:hypothetical protein
MTTTLWLLLWLLTPQAQLGTVSGRVVIAGDNVPVANEAVGLWPRGTVVHTGLDGRFAFTGVPAGQYRVIVIHDRIKASVAVSLGERQGVEGVLVVVNPAPAITGTVFDPFGLRLASARVDAYRMVYRPTGAHLRTVKSVMTDDFGAFRLYRLPPGEHYVSASYSERVQRSGGAAYRWSPNVSSADDGFPTLYFGDRYNATQSQKITLGQADSSGVSIFFKEGPRYSVSGRMVGPDGDVCGRVAIVPEGGVVDAEIDFAVGGCGRFIVKGLSPGLHVLFAVGKGFASDAIRINIPDRNVADLSVTMERTVTVRGRVAVEAAAAPSPGAAAPGGRGRGGGVNLFAPTPTPRRRVVLWRSSNEITQKIQADVDADGRFEIPEVGPGFFDVFVDPLSDGTFVKAIQQGAQDLMARPAELIKNVGDVNIQLSARSATAEGVALDSAARPVPDAQVVLVPTILRNRDDRYYSAYADPGGNFRISGIAPGTYFVFAFEDLDVGAYFVTAYDDGVARRWLPRGRQILFSDGQAGEPLKLSIIPATETVGGVLR